MKQVFISATGAADKLQVKEGPEPQPAEGEVRVRMAASGVNFADILARQGLYPDAPKIPCVVGYEVSGRVEAIGPGVDQHWLDQEVFGMTRFGGYSDSLCIPVKQLFFKPAQLSHSQAAAIPVNYLTAWQLLVVMGSLQPDETVLIHNAGGGVGLAAIDIAKHIGATAIGTASAGKHEFLLQRGLDHAIDYRNKDWAIELDKLTQERGVELITDPLGGAHWKKSYKALRSTGRLGMFGISTVSGSRLFGPLPLVKMLAGLPVFGPLGLMDKNRGSFGVNMGHLWHETDKIRTWMDRILKGIEAGWARPHVDASFPLDQAAQAHQYMEDRRNTGKVVLTNPDFK